MWEKNLKIQMNICIRISEPLCRTLEINTTLQINYAPVKKKKWCVCVCVCVCVYATKHYSAIKINDALSFATTQIDLYMETIMLIK